MALAAHPDIDVVALDPYMPGLSGIETLERIHAMDNHPPVIVVTGAQDSRMAVAALKAGAFDYVVKDIQGEFIFLLKAAALTAPSPPCACAAPRKRPRPRCAPRATASRRSPPSARC